MSLFNEIQQLKAQIVDTERMLKLVGEHPLMAESLNEKLNYIKNQLEKFPKDLIEPKITLLFSGGAVKGSLGIKSKFVSKTIKPIQELIKTQASLIRFGEIGKRGQSKKSANTDLYLTALPTGSFGIELSQLESNDLFDELDVANGIQNVMKLIDAVATSDEKFEEAIENIPQRNLSNLRDFLKVVSSEDSILKMESGNFGIVICEERIRQAFERVDYNKNKENDIIVSGVLRGILLDSGKFEVITDEGKSITGFINSEITEEQLIQFDIEFLNKPCNIHMFEHKISFKTGKEKTNYELLDISNIK